MKDRDDIDKHIISSYILGVDITEVYSPARVNEVARRWGLKPGSSVDLTNGYDFTKPEARKRAWAKIKEEDPFLIIGSPPCTLFSLLQELNIRLNGNKNLVFNDRANRNRKPQNHTHKIIPTRFYF